ncbi:hypothetical protein GRS48_11635 [Halorubrum sp. JWXQ-INN 858]|uniref:hypothetical protein n=1 Tax=Halorubrum sp. JWXQ-INN 858 TaxID=2690782 RepID=UPI0013572DC8|nr:hypothetical protein [Halorubrum sp. JWXQ-INN 858]MWV65462.1 hypothetical protein [Halorubrum sp. JWXQ-INN 858]
MNRREVLYRTGAGLTATAFAGCGDDAENSSPSTPARSTPNPPTEPEVFDRFERVIDVTDRGADPSGEDSLLSTLVDIDPDGTLVYLPEGRYRIDDSWSVEGFERFGIYGPEATIVPDPGTDAQLFQLDGRDRGEELHLEGISFDYSKDGASGRMFNAQARDGLLVRDVSAEGTVDRGPSLARVDVTTADGSGLVDELRLPDGAEAGTGITGCYVGNNSRGSITFKNCQISGFPDNGLYADPPMGRIVVDGGSFQNSGIANVRVRGGSLVQNVYVRCDDRHREFDNMRGIRLTDYEPQPDSEPAVVRNCYVDMLDATYSDGAIELSSQLARGIVRSTTVRVDADDVIAVRAKSPSSAFLKAGVDTSLQVSDLVVRGDATGLEAIRVVERDGSHLDRIDVRQPARGRDGVEFRRCVDGSLTDARVEVGGRPLVLTESDVVRRNVDLSFPTDMV